MAFDYVASLVLDKCFTHLKLKIENPHILFCFVSSIHKVS